jgi:hypothetical protein
MADIIDLVTRSFTDAAEEEFMARVTDQADSLRSAMRAGDLDNEDFAIGLEMEVYAINSAGDSHRLAPLPESVFDSGATKELGVHNAEINTDPNRFNSAGIAAQAESIEASFERAREAAQAADRDLVLDAMWTTAPAAGSAEYLSDHEERDGFTVAGNMRTDPRYVAIDNDVLRHANGAIPFEVPGSDREFPTILFESLATSIQPHLQIPAADDFPAYYNAAIRTLGPLLALSTNSPFLPPDLYTDVYDPESLVEETPHELRIPIFEQSVNTSPNDKVRVPSDIDVATDIVDGIVDDDLYAPFLREWIDDDPRASFADEYWEFGYKRSTYWRWLRCVVGGDEVDGAGGVQSLRIEYRPIPTQPTVSDVVGMQVLTVGLIRGLVAEDHPLPELPWAEAERSFDNAVQDGLDAEMVWILADGERTTDADDIFGEVFEYGRRGLEDAGLSTTEIDSYLDPIEARWHDGTTPSRWKKESVRSKLADGKDLTTAVSAMQSEYIELSRETDAFTEWY